MTHRSASRCVFATHPTCFEGMPQTVPENDWRRPGDFSDTSVEAVIHQVGNQEIVGLQKGLIPSTFEGLEERGIAVAHVDVDIYKLTEYCCWFIYPRTLAGGFLIFDDCGFPTCPGARAAVDDFFRSEPEVPLVLPTGQAAVVNELSDWTAKIKTGGILLLYLPHPDCWLWRRENPFMAKYHEWVPTPIVVKEAVTRKGCEIVDFDDGPDIMYSFQIVAIKR